MPVILQSSLCHLLHTCRLDMKDLSHDAQESKTVEVGGVCEAEVAEYKSQGRPHTQLILRRVSILS